MLEHDVVMVDDDVDDGDKQDGQPAPGVEEDVGGDDDVGDGQPAPGVEEAVPPHPHCRSPQRCFEPDRSPSRDFIQKFRSTCGCI